MHILFREEQAYAEGATHKFVVGCMITVSVALIINIFVEGAELTGMKQLLITILLMAGVALIYTSIRLTCQITDSGITVRYFPFQPNATTFTWTQIEDVYLRDFNPLQEFRGWGIKYGFNGTKSYTMAGNTYGIQINLKDGGQVLIGTRRWDDVRQVLKQFQY